MLEVPNVAVPLSRMREGSPLGHDALVRAAVVKRLRLTPDDVNGIVVLRRSIDARRGREAKFIHTVLVSLRGGANAERALLAKLERRGRANDARPYEMPDLSFPAKRALVGSARPVVVGAGCAGLFCALALAEAGLEPLLIERGDDAARRTEHVERFDATGRLDTESNIQFGLGGAGTFSDGKLSTGTKSPLHRLVLETFVSAGAPADILFDSKPHIGSDILPAVVTAMMERIRSLGGEVRCRTKLTGLVLEGSGDHRKVVGVDVVSRTQGPVGEDRTVEDGAFDVAPGVEREERIPASAVVLACGHSARDVFELLRDLGVRLERKTFAMGVRIEHRQKDVDRCQYGKDAGDPLLGAAPYKLVARAGERSAYTFCMCPGGYVVAAASEAFGVVTNGMSLRDRAGKNANAGLLANVNPEDLPGDDVLAGVELQRECEHKAYAAGGGGFVAPAQLVGDFLQGVPSSGVGHVKPTYPRGVAWGTIDGLLPGYITDSLRANLPAMASKLRCFGDREAVLTGVETRSSSPVRVVRGDDGQCPGIEGLFPAGEGAGYAGGIMSAATDGLTCAFSVADAVAPR